MKILLATFIVIVIAAVINYIMPTDSTDKSRWRRSGLRVYTDQATGVQYLRAGSFSGITPRLNSDGTLYNVKDRD